MKRVFADQMVRCMPATTPQAAKWSTTKVSKAMHSGVITVSPSTALTKVAKLMANGRLHCVVVATPPIEVGSLWGIVTDLDLMAAASVRSLEDQCAAGSASTPAVLISPHARLTDAAELMTRHGVTHLVVAEARRPVGVLSTLDVALAIADSAPD
jgi:CBS domain-containing protein